MNEEVNTVWGLICIIWVIAIALFLTMYAPNNTPSATNSISTLLHLLVSF